MNMPQAQIKLNLPLPLKKHLESKANLYGLPLASYLKHLIVKDMESVNYPVYELSEETKRSYKKALKERHKAIEVKGDIGEFLDNL